MPNATVKETLADFWLEWNGSHVRIEGMLCMLRVEQRRAIYPYPHDVLDVSAVPTMVAKRSEAYLRIKDDLRDDWDFSVLATPELESEVREQLAKYAERGCSGCDDCRCENGCEG
jgi:hypothetical protein